MAFFVQAVSAIGFLISLYFILVSKGILSHSNKLIGMVCSKDTCTRVIDTPYARVFKIPNFELGIVYYAAIFAISFLTLSKSQGYAVIAVAWFTVAVSAYLAYALLFKLKTNCNLCFAAQLINLLIAIFFTFKI